MTRSASTGIAGSSAPGHGARLPVLAAFAALALLTAMSVVAGVEREVPERTPAAAPPEPRLEVDASELTPMAGLIPWALPEWPIGPDAPVGESLEPLNPWNPLNPLNPALPLGPVDGPGGSVEPGGIPGTDPGVGHDEGSPEEPDSADPAAPTESGEPVDPSGADPSDADPPDSDPDGADPSDADPDEVVPPADAGPEHGEVRVNDVGIGGISNTTDETGVSNLSVPTTTTSSTSALSGMVATVTLTLHSTGPADPALPDGSRAPVIVKSAGGAAWTCRGPGGEPIGDGQDHAFPSGVTLTCTHTYSPETPAPTLNLRILADGLQGVASISVAGNEDPNPDNNTGSF